MIVVRLSGGLGNQMFQYAAGCEVACRLKTQLVLDGSEFDVPGYHHLSIVHQRIEAQFYDSRTMPSRPGRFGDSWPRRLLQRFRTGQPTLHFVRERGQLWTDLLERAVDHSYLQGYWQSERFFSGVREKLVREFRPARPLNEQDHAVLDAMAESNSVLVHVRRGDYVSNTRANQVHGTCDTAYYTKAVKRLSDEFGELHLFVFSDDPRWCRENLQFDHPVTFVDHNDASRNCEELWLMQHARHFVIANSSFSWWAAWLGDFPGKRIIAPKPWYRDSGRDEGDLIPASWERI